MDRQTKTQMLKNDYTNKNMYIHIQINRPINLHKQEQIITYSRTNTNIWKYKLTSIDINIST